MVKKEKYFEECTKILEKSYKKYTYQHPWQKVFLSPRLNNIRFTMGHVTWFNVKAIKKNHPQQDRVSI